MRYWWVNQNQTFKHEIQGGYIWSPKKNKNNARNPFYENMREVSPGDLIFSFKDAHIQAIGIAQTYCHESPKPLEFGTTGTYWQNIGWKVNVQYTLLSHKIRPKDHIEFLRPSLPTKYSPLQTTGNGSQSVYLAEISQNLTHRLMELIGKEADRLLAIAQAFEPIASDDLYDAELKIEKTLFEDTSIPETQRLSLVLSRIGQGVFKSRVSQIETHCRITHVHNHEHLVASHCKPWRDATNEERLDGQNGLLLTPSIDHLFDRGFIGFENNGELIISPVAHRPSLQLMGIDTENIVNVGNFTQGQKEYLSFHRDAIFLQTRRSK